MTIDRDQELAWASAAQAGDRAAMQGWSANEFIGAKGVLTPQTVTVDGDTVTVIGDWRSTHANGLSSFAFVVAGDKLASMTIREG